MVNETRDYLFLDDLHVGQTFTSPSHRLDAEQIKRFAKEFDPQPFHLDENAAAQSLFAGLAASGWHTAALTMRLLVNGGAPIAGGLIGAGGEIAWLKPTRPGDELHVVSEVMEIIPVPLEAGPGNRGVAERDPEPPRRSRSGADVEACGSTEPVHFRVLSVTQSSGNRSGTSARTCWPAPRSLPRRARDVGPASRLAAAP